MDKESLVEPNSRSPSVSAYITMPRPGWDIHTNGTAAQAVIQNNDSPVYSHIPVLREPLSPPRNKFHSATSIASSTRNDSLPYTTSPQSISTSIPPEAVQSNGFAQYRYIPLRGHDEIRLLKVLPNHENSDIKVELVSVKLETQAAQYFALTYCWGSDPPDHNITLAGFVKPIISILYDALKALRLRDASRYVWIDALCIDQDSIQDKHSQMQKMSQIYSKAEEVVIWLGGRGSDGDLAIPFLSSLLSVNRFDELIESLNEKFKALEELLRHKWFTGRWVLQDVALAKKATLWWGTASIQWDDFSDAIRLLEAQFDSSMNLRKNVDFLSRDSTRRVLPAIAYMHAVRSVFRKAENGEIIERLCSLELLVSSMAAFETSDPRHTIYAVLALAKGDHGIIADYDKDILDVYTDFVEYCINTSGSLDIICRHWARDSSKKKGRLRDSTGEMLPSWIPSVLGSPFATFVDVNSNTRLHGDSFVGLPNFKNYNASLGTLLAGKCEIKRDTGKIGSGVQLCRILSVVGIVVSEIREIGERAMHGIIPSAWLEWPSEGETTMPDSLWRTLVANRDPNGNDAPSWYRSACYHVISRSQDPDINTTQMIKDPETPSLVVKFLKRVQSVIWNRKLFLALDKNGEGRRGLAPAQAQVGDFLCVFFGCSVPVVLRKTDPGQWRLIGEAYLHDMMDGQALIGKTKEEIQRLSQNFDLI